MSGWTHPMCWFCWERLNGNRQPHVLSRPDWEDCCWCGIPTRSGIYARADPATLDHCGGHGD